MRNRMLLALIILTATVGPASAQRSDNERGGLRTETQTRLAEEETNDILWNSIGLLGLLGLLGFRRRHGDDSYHPAPLE